MLDERKTAILSAVVQEYIATALPVGSTHIADAPGVKVSSATVRNEMAVLEQEGYLIQPHTSAGRVPTDKGYRFFVDHLGHARPARRRRRGRGRRLLPQRPRPPRGDAPPHVGPARPPDQLRRRRRRPAAVAVAVRSVQIVGLSTTMATVVVVLGNGSVESETIDARPDVVTTPTSPRRRRTSPRQLTGRSLAAAPALLPCGDDVVDRICADALAACAPARSDEHVYMGGTSSMASAFDAVEIVRDVLRTLEQQFVVVSLVGDLVDRGCRSPSVSSMVSSRSPPAR